MTPNGRLAEPTSTGQHGYLTRRQANADGITDAMLRRRIQSGVLEKVGTNTFASPLLPRTTLGQLHALMVDIGGEVWACGPTAAALDKFDDFVLAPPFHLVTERNRKLTRIGHVIHTVMSLDPIDREEAEGIPVTSPTRTLIDLARCTNPKLLTTAIDSALRDRLTTEEFLHRRINELRAKGRYRIPRLLAVIEGAEITRGGHSWLERRFLELVAKAGIAAPETQVVLGRRKDSIVRVDCFFRRSNLVVELLGYRWHRTALQMASDADRANRLTLDGHRMLQFAYSTVAEHPDQVIVDLVAALGL